MPARGAVGPGWARVLRVLGSPCGSRVTLLDAFLCHASGRGEAPAVADTEGNGLSYEGLLSRASRVARLLVERHRVEPGGYVALVPINTVASAAVFLASWLAGAVPVVVDAASPWEEVVFQLSTLEQKPRVVVVEEGFEERHCPAAERLGAACATAQSLLREAGGGAAWEGYARPRPSEPGLVYFYAGVAGRTLPVIHSHGGLAGSAAATAAHYGLGQGDRSFVSPPISHALGLQLGLLAMLYAGGSAVLYTKRGRLDPRHAAEALASSRASIAWGAPGFYAAVLGAGYRGHPGLRYAVSAGAPLPRETQEEWRKATGVELLQLYGMTEAAPLTATLPGDNPPGSIGRPVPGAEIRLVDPETLEPVDNGPGEALARGPMVMAGYGDPGETARALLPGGWLRTGDILEADEEGHLYFRGVRKRMLKYKGYPIFPRDLELLLESHPAVARAEVYGVDTPHGQAPAARVWLRGGAEATGEELLRWANERLAPYKRLIRVEVAGRA